jgi:RNA polymerase sigma factor (TIGR02999 family)
MGDVTLILRAAQAGKAGAADQLWQAVYQELRSMASEKMAGEARAITLSATALVHEAWLRLSGPGGTGLAWDGRAHFFAAAAEAMRRILVDQARRRLSQKRGGGREHVPLENAPPFAAPEDTKVVHVHDVLDALEAENPQQAQIVKLRFFVGLSQKEIGELLDISEKTVQRQWVLARTWLYENINGPARGENAGEAFPDESASGP